MLVIHLTSSLRRGGRERQLVTLCKYSESEKLNTRIVCFNRTKESYEEEYGLENSIIYLNSKSFKDRFIELARIIRREKADIIWSWGGLEATMGLLLSLTTKARHINGSVRHGIVLMKPDHIWRMLILHLSKNIVANSKAGLRANHLCRGTVMYNGLDESFFIDNGTQQNIIKTLIPSYQEYDMIFISVANLVPYKDYFTVILALEELRKTYKNFKYLIVGEGPKRSIIEQQIKGKGLENNIYLLGLRQKIKELLACSEILI